MYCVLSYIISVLTYVVLLGSTMDIQFGYILLLVDMPIDLHVAGLTSMCNWSPPPSHKTSTFIHWRKIKHNLMKFIQMIMQNGYSSCHYISELLLLQRRLISHNTDLVLFYLDGSPSFHLACTLSVFHFLIRSSLFLAYLGCGELK